MDTSVKMVASLGLIIAVQVFKIRSMEKEQQQIIERYNNLVDKYNNTLKGNIKLKDDNDKMTMILEEIAEKKRKGEFSTNTIDFCLKKAEAKRKDGYKKTA